ncbi:MAG: cation:proton antiporter [Haloarculaceae archaeon]
MSTAVLTATAIILALGIAAQVLAKRLKIPSVLFLILIGVGLGPSGIGFVTADTFGAGLSTVVGLSVAIIVFDGAFQLRREQLRQTQKAVIGLTTVGALAMLFGTALTVRVFLDTGWGLSLLVGSLLIATGPTVITPIFEVITVREHLKTTFEAEGIFNDVTAAILSIVIFETVVVESAPTDIPFGFLQRLGIGVLVGVGIAVAIWLFLTRVKISASDAPRVARLTVLSAVILAYGLSEAVLAETGVAAVAAAGLVLGNAELAHRESIHQFNRDLTLVVLAIVFISLAALIDFDALLGLGVGGLAVVAVVTLVIRPIVVFLSAQDPQFTRNETLFLSLVGPRGIIPASIATLFAIELQGTGQSGAAQILAGTVFLVIFVTIVLQAGLARQIATVLGVIPMPTILIGGGRVGRMLAERLQNRGENVLLIDADQTVVDQLQRDGFAARHGDGTETEVLRSANAERATRVIAVTRDDNTNLLVAQLARTKFDVDDVFARVNDPENVETFETLDVTAIDATRATAWSIDNEIERPELAHWMNALGDDHDVQQIELTADDLVGQTIREVNAEIPAGCIVAVIGRDGETHVPSADESLQYGDTVTFLGQQSAVSGAVRRFHPRN